MRWKKNQSESLYIKLNLRNRKLLKIYQKRSTDTHLNRLSKSLGTFSSDYEKIIMFGDFNVKIDKNHMKPFCESYGLTNLVKQLTCYKNPTNPSSIDLLLTNVPRSF